LLLWWWWWYMFGNPKHRTCLHVWLAMSGSTRQTPAWPPALAHKLACCAYVDHVRRPAAVADDADDAGAAAAATRTSTTTTTTATAGIALRRSASARSMRLRPLLLRHNPPLSVHGMSRPRLRRRRLLLTFPFPLCPRRLLRPGPWGRRGGAHTNAGTWWTRVVVVAAAVLVLVLVLVD
jgi:hypothetical protein